MPSRTANSNVHQMDVLPGASLAEDAGSRTLRRGLAVLDAVLGAGPEGTRVVIFHGECNPPDALAGRRNRRFRYIRPALWVADHWRE